MVKGSDFIEGTFDSHRRVLKDILCLTVSEKVSLGCSVWSGFEEGTSGIRDNRWQIIVEVQAR